MILLIQRRLWGNRGERNENIQNDDTTATEADCFSVAVFNRKQKGKVIDEFKSYSGIYVAYNVISNVLY